MTICVLFLVKSWRWSRVTSLVAHGAVSVVVFFYAKHFLRKTLWSCSSVLFDFSLGNVGPTPSWPALCPTEAHKADALSKRKERERVVLSVADDMHGCGACDPPYDLLPNVSGIFLFYTSPIFWVSAYSPSSTDPHTCVFQSDFLLLPSCSESARDLLPLHRRPSRRRRRKVFFHSSSSPLEGYYETERKKKNRRNIYSVGMKSLQEGDDRRTGQTAASSLKTIIRILSKCPTWLC